MQTGTAPKTLAPDLGHGRESAPRGRDRGDFIYQPVAGVAITQSGAVWVGGKIVTPLPTPSSSFPQ